MTNWNNKEEVLEAVRKYLYHENIAFQYVSKELRGDREVVMAAVRRNGLALQYASKELRGDRKIVLLAVKHECRNYLLDGVEEAYARWEQIGNIRYKINKALDSSPKTVKQIISTMRTFSALQYASKELRGDREVVLAAIRNEVCYMNNNLQYTSKELRGDREVVLAAVRYNGLALQYASKELKEDKVVVIEAAKENIYSLIYACEILLNKGAIHLLMKTDTIRYKNNLFKRVPDQKVVITNSNLQYYLNPSSSKKYSFY